MSGQRVALGIALSLLLAVTACTGNSGLGSSDGAAESSVSGDGFADSGVADSGVADAFAQDDGGAEGLLTEFGADVADSGVADASVQSDGGAEGVVTDSGIADSSIVDAFAQGDGESEMAMDGQVGGDASSFGVQGFDAADGAFQDGSLTDAGGTVTSRILGFTPSNLGDILEGVDTSKLIEVDIEETAPAMYSSYDDSQNFSYSVVPPLIVVGNPPPFVDGGVVYKTVTQADGSTIGVYIAASWVMGDPAHYGFLEVEGAYPLALVALDGIYVYGPSSSPFYFNPVASRIDVGANHNVVGAGGYDEPDGGGGPGEGATALANGVLNGGGGAFCGAGGPGGAFAGGVPVPGGTPYGSPTLIPLQGGSGGGGFYAGAGGGAIELVAGGGIEVDGVLEAYGGAANGFYGSQGGGGSGGGVLLEAPSVRIEGLVSASGGGDRISTAPESPLYPGDQVEGYDDAGHGGWGTTIAGGAGLDGNADGGVLPTGGGGGTGYIRINTAGPGASGLTVGPNATLSPALGTMCTTQGGLAP